MKKTVSFLALALFAFMQNPALAKKTEGNPYTGKNLYRSFCAICHGIDGKTKGPLAEKMGLSPPDLTASKYQKKNVDELTEIIGGYGRKAGSEMPQWTDALPESNLRHIAAYIGTMTQTDLRLIADLNRGRLIYKNACAACHGPRGNGNGILAVMMKAKMTDLTTPEAAKRLSDEELVHVIKNGRGRMMPAWLGTLNENEIIDVAAYIRRLQRRR